MGGLFFSQIPKQIETSGPMCKTLPCFLSHVVFLSLFALLGCGGGAGSGEPEGTITITVTYGGEPVTHAVVNLENVDSGQAAGGELAQDGTTTIKKVRTGTYTVSVVPQEPDPAPPEPGQPPKKPTEFPNIPQKFRMLKTSPLTVEVIEGTNELQVDLKE